MVKQKYYAVYGGREGFQIYLTWDEVRLFITRSCRSLRVTADNSWLLTSLTRLCHFLDESECTCSRDISKSLNTQQIYFYRAHR